VYHSIFLLYSVHTVFIDKVYALYFGMNFVCVSIEKYQYLLVVWYHTW
jgi:hypothetical protein